MEIVCLSNERARPGHSHLLCCSVSATPLQWCTNTTAMRTVSCLHNILILTTVFKSHGSCVQKTNDLRTGLVTSLVLASSIPNHLTERGVLGRNLVQPPESRLSLEMGATRVSLVHCRLLTLSVACLSAWRVFTIPVKIFVLVLVRKLKVERTLRRASTRHKSIHHNQDG